MKTKEELIQQFRDYQDHKLIEIIRYAGDYQPEAVEAATALIEERDLSQEQIDNIEAQFEVHEIKQSQAAQEGLSTGEKIICLLVPIIGMIIFILLQLKYHEKGNQKKASQSMNYTLAGYAILITSIFIFSKL